MHNSLVLQHVYSKSRNIRNRQIKKRPKFSIVKSDLPRQTSLYLAASGIVVMKRWTSWNVGCHLVHLQYCKTPGSLTWTSGIDLVKIKLQPKCLCCVPVDGDFVC